MKTFRIRERTSGRIALALTFGLALALAAPLVAAGPAAAQGGFFGSSNNREDGQLAVRLGQLEEQVRNLTGQIEELNHQLRQTQDQLRRAQEDNEFRFQELEGGKPGTGKRSQAPAAGTPADTARNSAGGNSYGRAPAPGTADPNDPYAAKREATVHDLGSYSVPEQGSGDQGAALGPSGQPLDLSALARGNSGSYGGDSYGGGAYEEPDNPPLGGNGVSGATGGTDAIGQLASASPDGSARQEYDQAYSMVLNGQYDQAAQLFKQFLAANPDDPLAANAQYWLGESYFGKGKYREAADAFLKTYTDYPANDKAPDSLLKLGLSLDGLGQKDAACATYSELLTKYPGASGAVLDQARKEQKSAGCRG
ncbi:tol-pal system protein YbgF [Breoghania corrubedonensis]|uniref:Cell division coordinator CpoB n=1 Tax=Breoghania corrubedonensis TaxID=665038 RepID=A0A2T5V7G2_9HYPH|nr:tol-pal system protein YbgF [Breoghania corrubedonensis]PTW59687.1 tol-pal system protein YbgF [Breoghania corrubedonensis]